MQKITVVPSSIVGNVIFITDRSLIVSVLSDRSLSLLNDFPTAKYLECRILDYRPDTGEIKVKLDNVTTNNLWYTLWRNANYDWARELNIKYIFIE